MVKTLETLEEVKVGADSERLAQANNNNPQVPSSASVPPAGVGAGAGTEDGSTGEVGAGVTRPNRAVRDTQALLEMVKDGVLVTLAITRPSFTATLSFEDLALASPTFPSLPATAPAKPTSTPASASASTADQSLPTSASTLIESESEAELTDYDPTLEVPAELAAVRGQFQLGRKKLLPDEMYRRLDGAENAGRRALYSNSFNYRDSTRGSRFVAGTRFDRWQEQNAQAEANFWKVAQEIIDTYDKLCQEVVLSYRKVAEFAWRNQGRKRLAALIKGAGSSGSGSVSEAEIEKLKLEHTEFVSAYLERVRKSLPTLAQVKAGFSYRYSVTNLALPLEIATNEAVAAEIRRQEDLKRAELKARLTALQAQEDQQQAEVWAKRTVEAEKARLEQQAARRKLELDLARLDRAQKLEEAYIQQVKAQKDEMLSQFWTNLVAEINQTIAEGCQNALDTLDNNGGRLPGRGRQGLVSMLDKLVAFKDYIQDEELAAKIEKLHAVMPPLHTPTVGQGRDRVRGVVDTAPLRRVLDSMQREAQDVLFDLENNPVRTLEADDAIVHQPSLVDTKARAGAKKRVDMAQDETLTVIANGRRPAFNF